MATDYYKMITESGGDGAKVPSPPKYDYASALLEGKPFQPQEMETGEISTITGKPKMGAIEDPTDAADFGTIMRTAFVDNPETKIDIFAEARFPDMEPEERRKKYGIMGGDVVFLSDDGTMRREVPADRFGKIKKFTAEIPAQAPAIIGGTAGSIFGVAGAGLGAGAGELVRKGVGLALGEPADPFEIAKDVGVEAALGLGGEALGRLPGAITKKIVARRGARLMKAAGKTAEENINPAAAKHAAQQAKKWGIELYSPQTTESPELINKFKLLGDMPKTANMIKGKTKQQQKQIQGAIEKFADTVSPETTPYESGKALSDTAQKVIDNLKKNRQKSAAPIYEKAFSDFKKSGQSLNFSTIKKDIDNILIDMPEGSQSQKALSRVKKMLETEPSNHLKFANNVKKEIDAMVSGPDGAYIPGETSAKLMEVKGSLSSMAKEASPGYKKALKTFEDASPEIEEAEKRIIGRLSRLQGETMTTASKKLLSATEASPESVRYAKKLIEGQNPDVWNAVTRTHLTDMFEKVKGSASGGEFDNLGGRFYKNTLGDQKQRNILKAVMGPEKFQGFSDFADILRRTSLTAGAESRTAPAQIALQEMKGEGGSKIAGLMQFNVTQPMAQIGQKINQTMFGKYQKQLAEAMLNPNAIKEIKKIKGITNKTKRLKTFSTFLSLVIGGEYAKPGLPEMEIPSQAFWEQTRGKK